MMAEGKVRMFLLGERVARYDPMVEEHDHFICQHCGRVEDVTLPQARQVNLAALVQKGFTVTAHSLATGLLMLLWKYFILGGGFADLFGSSAGLWITMGGLFGTIMWFNVWFIIWPAQQKLITWTQEGRKPDDPPERPATLTKATHASRTNVFLSVPMLFGMLAGAGHYPSLSFFPWVIIVIALGAGLAYYMLFKFSAGVAKTWP